MTGRFCNFTLDTLDIQRWVQMNLLELHTRDGWILEDCQRFARDRVTFKEAKNRNQFHDRYARLEKKWIIWRSHVIKPHVLNQKHQHTSCCKEWNWQKVLKSSDVIMAVIAPSRDWKLEETLEDLRYHSAAWSSPCRWKRWTRRWLKKRPSAHSRVDIVKKTHRPPNKDSMLSSCIIQFLKHQQTITQKTNKKIGDWLQQQILGIHLAAGNPWGPGRRNCWRIQPSSSWKKNIQEPDEPHENHPAWCRVKTKKTFPSFSRRDTKF